MQQQQRRPLTVISPYLGITHPTTLEQNEIASNEEDNFVTSRQPLSLSDFLYMQQESASAIQQQQGDWGSDVFDDATTTNVTNNPIQSLPSVVGKRLTASRLIMDSLIDHPFSVSFLSADVAKELLQSERKQQYHEEMKKNSCGGWRCPNKHDEDHNASASKNAPIIHPQHRVVDPTNMGSTLPSSHSPETIHHYHETTVASLMSWIIAIREGVSALMHKLHAAAHQHAHFNAASHRQDPTGHHPTDLPEGHDHHPHNTLPSSCIQILVQVNASLKDSCFFYHNNLLHCAALLNQPEILEIFLGIPELLFTRVVAPVSSSGKTKAEDSDDSTLAYYQEICHRNSFGWTPLDLCLVAPSSVKFLHCHDDDDDEKEDEIDGDQEFQLAKSEEEMSFRVFKAMFFPPDLMNVPIEKNGDSHHHFVLTEQDKAFSLHYLKCLKLLLSHIPQGYWTVACRQEIHRQGAVGGAVTTLHLLIQKIAFHTRCIEYLAILKQECMHPLRRRGKSEMSGNSPSESSQTPFFQYPITYILQVFQAKQEVLYQVTTELLSEFVNACSIAALNKMDVSVSRLFTNKAPLMKLVPYALREERRGEKENGGNNNLEEETDDRLLMGKFLCSTSSKVNSSLHYLSEWKHRCPAQFTLGVTAIEQAEMLMINFEDSREIWSHLVGVRADHLPPLSKSHSEFIHNLHLKLRSDNVLLSQENFQRWGKCVYQLESLIVALQRCGESGVQKNGEGGNAVIHQVCQSSQFFSQLVARHRYKDGSHTSLLFEPANGSGKMQEEFDEGQQQLAPIRMKKEGALFQDKRNKLHHPNNKASVSPSSSVAAVPSRQARLRSLIPVLLQLIEDETSLHTTEGEKHRNTLITKQTAKSGYVDIFALENVVRDIFPTTTTGKGAADDDEEVLSITSEELSMIALELEKRCDFLAGSCGDENDARHKNDGEICTNSSSSSNLMLTTFQFQQNMADPICTAFRTWDLIRRLCLTDGAAAALYYAFQKFEMMNKKFPVPDAFYELCSSAPMMALHWRPSMWLSTEVQQFFEKIQKSATSAFPDHVLPEDPRRQKNKKKSSKKQHGQNDDGDQGILGHVLWFVHPAPIPGEYFILSIHASLDDDDEEKSKNNNTSKGTALEDAGFRSVYPPKLQLSLFRYDATIFTELVLLFVPRYSSVSNSSSSSKDHHCSICNTEEALSFAFTVKNHKLAQHILFSDNTHHHLHSNNAANILNNLQQVFDMHVCHSVHSNFGSSQLFSTQHDEDDMLPPYTSSTVHCIEEKNAKHEEVVVLLWGFFRHADKLSDETISALTNFCQQSQSPSSSIMTKSGISVGYLVAACLSNSPYAVNYLLSSAPTTLQSQLNEVVDSISGETALTAAIKSANAHCQLVYNLLLLYPSLSVTNQQGWAPLTLAAARGEEAIVLQMLHQLSASASDATRLSIVNHQTKVGNRERMGHGGPAAGLTPLIASLMSPNPRIAEHLIRAGASTAISLDSGLSPLLTAKFMSATNCHLLIHAGGQVHCRQEEIQENSARIMLQLEGQQNGPLLFITDKPNHDRANANKTATGAVELKRRCTLSFTRIAESFQKIEAHFCKVEGSCPEPAFLEVPFAPFLNQQFLQEEQRNTTVEPPSIPHAPIDASFPLREENLNIISDILRQQRHILLPLLFDPSVFSQYISIEGGDNKEDVQFLSPFVEFVEYWAHEVEKILLEFYSSPPAGRSQEDLVLFVEGCLRCLRSAQRVNFLYRYMHLQHQLGKKKEGKDKHTAEKFSREFHDDILSFHQVNSSEHGISHLIRDLSESWNPWTMAAANAASKNNVDEANKDRSSFNNVVLPVPDVLKAILKYTQYNLLLQVRRQRLLAQFLDPTGTGFTTVLEYLALERALHGFRPASMDAISELGESGGLRLGLPFVCGQAFLLQKPRYHYVLCVSSGCEQPALIYTDVKGAVRSKMCSSVESLAEEIRFMTTLRVPVGIVFSDVADVI